jgi:hypothetical protein
VELRALGTAGFVSAFNFRKGICIQSKEALMSRNLLVAAMLLSALAYPQMASAAKFCAQPRGAHQDAQAHPDCSFATLDECQASIKEQGGGHCYKLHD